jgi:hypothetical protein
MLLGEDERLVANSVAEAVDVEVEGKITMVWTVTLHKTTNTKTNA